MWMINYSFGMFAIKIILIQPLYNLLVLVVCITKVKVVSWPYFCHFFFQFDKNQGIISAARVQKNLD